MEFNRTEGSIDTLISDHLQNTGPDVQSGLIVLGGAMLEEPIKEGVPPKMTGSVLMCVADTKEEVMERVKKDVYYTSDVWDKEKVSSWDWDTLGREMELWYGELNADVLYRSKFSHSRALLGRGCK